MSRPNVNPVLQALALDALGVMRAHVPLEYGVTVVIHEAGADADFQLMSTLHSHTELDAFLTRLVQAMAVDPAGGEL